MTKSSRNLDDLYTFDAKFCCEDLRTYMEAQKHNLRIFLLVECDVPIIFKSFAFLLFL